MEAKRTVWKFPFEVADHIEIQMPDGAEFLSVSLQRGQPCMWCAVIPSNVLVARYFELRGTGHAFSGTEGEFLGTFQMMGAALVFHLFASNRVEL